MIVWLIIDFFVKEADGGITLKDTKPTRKNS